MKTSTYFRTLHYCFAGSRHVVDVVVVRRLTYQCEPWGQSVAPILYAPIPTPQHMTVAACWVYSVVECSCFRFGRRACTMVMVLQRTKANIILNYTMVKIGETFTIIIMLGMLKNNTDQLLSCVDFYGVRYDLFARSSIDGSRLLSHPTVMYTCVSNFVSVACNNSCTYPRNLSTCANRRTGVYMRSDTVHLFMLSRLQFSFFMMDD